MSITAHNYDACRKKAAELSGGDASKLPVLQYRGGGKTVLLPKGQQVTLERFTQGPRKLTGKQLRRQRLADRRCAAAMADGKAAAATL